MDLQELGIGSQAPATVDQSGTAPANGSKYSDRLRQQRREAKRRYRERNREKVLEQDRLHKRDLRASDGGEKQRKVHATWREKNREQLRQYSSKYNAENKAKRLAQAKASREKNRDKINARQSDNYKINREKVLEQNRQWRKRNPEKMKQKERAYLPKAYENRKRRRAENPSERIKDACRTRVGFILKKAGIKKFDHTFELVGCTPDFLKAFLEAQFLPGMSWDNYGEWEIDHVVPLASFSLTDKRQLYAAFHYSNCKPLWKLDNRIKNASLPGPHQPLLV